MRVMLSVARYEDQISTPTPNPRIPCNQISGGNSYYREPGRGKNCPTAMSRTSTPLVSEPGFLSKNSLLPPRSDGILSLGSRNPYSNLYGSTSPICIAVLSWLLSLEERKPHLFCSTPSVYTAIPLPFRRGERPPPPHSKKMASFTKDRFRPY